MKKTVLVLLLLLIIIPGFTQLRVGILVGGQQSKVMETNDLPNWNDIKGNYSGRGGAHFGFIADLPFSAKSMLFFQPGVVFYNKGRKYAQSFDTATSDIANLKKSEFVNYVDIPLNLVLKFRLGRNARFLLGGGPYASFFYNGKLKTETISKDGIYSVDENNDLPVGKGKGQYSTFDYGVNALAGFEFGRVFLTANYSQGLHDFYQSADYDGSFKHQVMGVTLGVFLGKSVKAEKRVRDKDKDGVPDNLDKCPDVAGLAKYDGCPDGDNDGIGDNEDACPNEAGPPENKGCPYKDTDKDGILDKDDKCPTQFGTAENGGCPVIDTDKDGIPDKDDKCPTVAGIDRYNGCPIPDSDGDGINDELDKCPNVKGVASNGGCPEEVKKEIIQKVNYAAKQIQFQQSKAILLPVSYAVLDQVIVVLNQDPTLQLIIEGHTSKDGSDASNMVLSQKRADVVKAYFESKGVDKSRLTAQGFGSTHLLTAGTSSADRAKNRRVELKLSH